MPAAGASFCHALISASPSCPPRLQPKKVVKKKVRTDGLSRQKRMQRRWRVARSRSVVVVLHGQELPVA